MTILDSPASSTERRPRPRRRLLPPVWICGGAATLLATSIGVRVVADNGQTPQSVTPAAQVSQQVRDEEAFAVLGEQTTEKICIICHPWDNITQKRRTVSQWEEVMINMAQRGAPGTPEQFKIVTKFLARYYGLLHVNSAPAEEIATVLGLSAKDATAIVEYRKSRGKFADAAALAKVQGIDQKKIAEQLDALIFD